MTTRRELLGQAAGMMAGVAYTGCGLMHMASAQGPGPAQRREVAVNGKRVKTVDIHAHCHIPEALELIGQTVRFPGLVITPDRIKVMDEQGIDIEALSVNPNCWDTAERDLAAQIVKLQNEKLAEVCGKTPDRFVGLASVSLAYPDLAAEQLQDVVNAAKPLAQQRFSPQTPPQQIADLVAKIYPALVAVPDFSKLKAPPQLESAAVSTSQPNK